MYIFRASITTKDGRKIYAKDYGKKAFRIWIGSGKAPVKPIIKQEIAWIYAVYIQAIFLYFIVNGMFRGFMSLTYGTG